MVPRCSPEQDLPDHRPVEFHDETPGPPLGYFGQFALQLVIPPGAAEVGVHLWRCQQFDERRTVPGLGLAEHEPLGLDRGRRPGDGFEFSHGGQSIASPQTRAVLFLRQPIRGWGRASFGSAWGFLISGFVTAQGPLCPFLDDLVSPVRGCRVVRGRFACRVNDGVGAWEPRRALRLRIRRCGRQATRLLPGAVGDRPRPNEAVAGSCPVVPG